MQELLHSLGINWPVMIAQLVNFGILLAILAKFVYRPVMNLLEERRNKILEAESKSKKAEEASQSVVALKETITAEARAESVRIIEEAKAYGESMKKKIVDVATVEAQKIKDDAVKQISNERRKLLSDVRSEIGAIIVSAIEKAFGDVLDTRTQGKMVEQALLAIRESDDSKSKTK